MPGWHGGLLERLPLGASAMIGPRVRHCFREDLPQWFAGVVARAVELLEQFARRFDNDQLPGSGFDHCLAEKDRRRLPHDDLPFRWVERDHIPGLSTAKPRMMGS